MRPGRFHLAVVAATVLATACSGVRTTRFVNPGFNFGFVEKVAVLQFENLSSQQQAGGQATRYFITQLLASGSVDVVEVGEVRAAAGRAGIVGTSASTEQLVALGKALGVQAIVMGTVTEAGEMRSGATTTPVVSLDVRMIEAETGTTVWAATHTERGGSVGARVFGTGGEALAETMRRCVKVVVKRLVG